MRGRERVRGAKPRPSIYSGAAGKFRRAVDAFVGLFSPRAEHARQKARMQSVAMLSYEAAVVDRMMPKEQTRSADAEILGHLPTMRARSRRQARDDGHAFSAGQVYVDAVVGDGIRPQCATSEDATGRGPSIVRKWRKACEDYFEQWSTKMADATREGTFYDLQSLVAITRKTDGECFTHAVVGGDNMLTIEVIDADRVCNPDHKSDTQSLRSGIEVDEKGRAVRYHIASAHPDDLELWKRVSWSSTEPDLGEMSVVQHHKRKGRPGQTRGVPDSASSAQYLEHLHHYLKSEIIGARAAANYAMFIKKSVSASDADILPVQISVDAGSDLEYHENLEAGTIAYLNEGEEPFAFNPNRPGAGDSFVMRMLRAYAASHGMSYERLARNWGGMNYTSMRGQLKEEERGFSRDRALLNRQFNTPWWRNVIRHGIQTGALVPPPSYLDNPEPWLAVEWIPPPMGYVDAGKEIAASRDAIDANLSTPWHEAGRSGLDPEVILERKAAFFARAAELEEENRLRPGSLTGGVAVSIGSESDPNQQGDKDEDDTATPSPVEDDDENEDESEVEVEEDDDDSDDKDDENSKVKSADTASETGDKAAKARLDAIGVAMRSGLISPQQADEERTRADLDLPPMSDSVREAWEAEPVRRPVTLSPVKDSAVEQADGDSKNDEDDE